MQNKWIGALLVAACTSFPASAQTLRMAIADDATTLDPHSANILGSKVGSDTISQLKGVDISEVKELWYGQTTI
jgi:ABC-type transport system substrate-binding protein